MNNRRLAFFVAATCVTLAVASTIASTAEGAQKDSKENPRPRIILRAQPPVAVAPARIAFTAELVGGANDFEEYYCPTISWEWGDDTKSESTVDCEPYEAGKSEIKRRFTVQHVFQQDGSQKVFFRLKRRNKDLGTAWVTVSIRPGAAQF